MEFIAKDNISSPRGAGRLRCGLPAVKSSCLLDVIFHRLTCGGYLHFCDVNQILIRVDVSLRVHVVSFMTLKNFRIVHFPGPLFGNIAAIPVSP